VLGCGGYFQDFRGGGVCGCGGGGGERETYKPNLTTNEPQCNISARQMMNEVSNVNQESAHTGKKQKMANIV